MFSIPRDLYVPISGGGSGKIDQAYEQGGSDVAVRSVENDLDVRVDYWAWIGLTGLVKLVDQVGGIDISPTNAVLDDAYPNDVNSQDQRRHADRGGIYGELQLRPERHGQSPDGPSGRLQLLGPGPCARGDRDRGGLDGELRCGGKHDTAGRRPPPAPALAPRQTGRGSPTTTRVSSRTGKTRRARPPRRPSSTTARASGCPRRAVFDRGVPVGQVAQGLSPVSRTGQRGKHAFALLGTLRRWSIH